MLDTYAFGELLGESGFRDFSGVPCSYLAPLINYAINEGRFVMANNEGEAVAIASGVSLANSALGKHSALSDKSGSLSLTSSIDAPVLSPRSRLHNPDFSSQILECSGKPSEECKENIESKESLDSIFSSLDSESRTIAESLTPKNPSEALPNSNNMRDNASLHLSRKVSARDSERGEVFCDDFACFASEDEGATLGGSDRSPSDAIKQKRAKDKPSTEYGVVLMQNSGLSNALSPLTSLNHTFGIPILGFVSLRGERDERGHNTDEPQHELLGVITDKLLETCEIEYAFLSADFDEAKKQVLYAHKVLESNKSFFFIVRDKTFIKVPLRYNPLQEMGLQNDDCPIAQTQEALPTRLQALEVIQHIAIESKSTLLATTGKCGRELYELGDTPNQLYMVGSMGCVGALGLGIALKNETKVIAIDGDSALLMRLGALSTNAYYAKIRDRGNFCHILLDNESHDSTGGQFNLSPFVDFCAIARASGYECVYHARDVSELGEVLRAFIDCERGGAWFVYLRIAKGSKEPLGRPKITPKQVATRLSRFLAISNGGEE
ncbi:thiamine pyrophosphate-dependent enzyme [uncultured Helicobacter sp.]|uniref:thiamine pyrophosphate-dependent enzyme n=1 Tax=uncultured Helicobacter sp. TaxID=175537 RepID=UPI00374F2AE1